MRAACVIVVLSLAVLGCPGPPSSQQAPTEEPSPMEQKLASYATVQLTADLSSLSDAQRQMIRLFVEAAQQMDDAFWMQAYGDRDALMASVSDPAARQLVAINYGPWDRLDGNAPFIDGVGAKPAGANLYPQDAGKEEIAAAAEADPELLSLTTFVRRDESGRLIAVPYHELLGAQYEAAAIRLEEAAALAEDAGLRRYLELRAVALRTGDYRASDLAWMDMKENTLDLVIGPIETYEDGLFGAKAASEAYVLLKDREWSDRLARYAEVLPELQRGLPVPEAYKQETPGSDSDLGAYDVLYYAGDCNAGSKTIAINLPNDETVQLEKGTRRLQLKNAMRAKFDGILVPIAEQLIAEEQRGNVTFDAFFANTMFHEVAHGLGIKNTITGKGTVREALAERASALEEGKADVLGLYMVTALAEAGELAGANLEDNYVTFLASIFRSIRFGSASAHGVANLIRFNFFLEQGAFARDPDSGTYRVDLTRMRQAADALSQLILTLQGDGDYDGVEALVAEKGVIGATLQADLDRLAAARIPVDVVFEQGLEVLGL